MRCFEEDEESCLPKRDEVLVVIENMIGGFKLVCVMIYIYIYINAGVLLEFDERGKKSGVCVSFCAFLRRQTFS